MKNYICIVLFFGSLLAGCFPNKTEHSMTKEKIKHIADSIVAMKEKEEYENKEKAANEISIPVKDLSETESTLFVPTLAKTFKKNKNAVYAATLCMAWKEIKDTLGTISKIEHPDVNLMHNANNYQNVLKDDEYSTSITCGVVGDTIRNCTAKAYFKKVLPFEYPLTKYDSSLSFYGQIVESFGFWGRSSAGINYYHSDDDFSITLYPKDREHEIILVKKPFSKSVSFEKEFDALTKNEKQFRDKKTKENKWMYYLQDDDKVRIPTTAFNLEHGFPKIVGSTFYVNDAKLWEITKFYQRNAFVLNEKGAIAESEAEIAAEACAEEEVEKPQPKQLYFDKEYLVFLKRKDAEYPYFALFVANTELLNTK